MAWIELHQSVWTHKKTLLLAAELDMSETHAVAHLIRLWTWALDNAPTGDISGLPPKVIAIGAGWDKDPEVFVRAAINAGWFDETDEGLFIHDWQDYAGRLIEKRKANAERMRRARAETVSDKCYERATHVQRTTSACAGATVPNRTVPNSTGNNSPPIIPPKGGSDERAAATEDNHATSGESLLVETATGEPNEVSHSKTQKRTKKTLSSVQKARFDRFWTVWPHKVSKGQAEITWGKLDPDDDLTGKIIEGVRRAIKYDRRFQPGGFMPHASTWLNAKGWEDEYTATEVNANAEHWRRTPEPPAFGSTAQAKNRFAGLARDGGTGRIAGGQDGPLGGGDGPSARDT